MDVVVEVLRFDGGVPSYTFRVTNNAKRPIYLLVVGADGELPPLVIAPETIPTSMSAPKGWEGTHVFGQDWRHRERHSPSLVSYLWTAEDSESRIQSGESLSGFSVQLPAPTRASPRELGEPVHSDLTEVSFLTHFYGARCPAVGTVQMN